MTEAEWRASPDAAQLCDESRARKRAWPRGAWGRKLTLAWCHWFRGRWGGLPPGHRAAVAAVEEWVDDPGADRAAAAAYRRLARPVDRVKTGYNGALHALLGHALKEPLRYERLRDRLLYPDGPAVLRDVFGNPFRPVAFDPAWRTSAAVGVARRMYDARDFAAMPILADALQDAGCEDADVLAHCRGDGPHARGCWVVDLVLGNG